MLAQGLLIAWASAVVAPLAGTVLAYVLAYVIQYRSFGWSIPTSPQPRFWVENLATGDGGGDRARPCTRSCGCGRSSPAANLRTE